MSQETKMGSRNLLCLIIKGLSVDKGFECHNHLRSSHPDIGMDASSCWDQFQF